MAVTYEYSTEAALESSSPSLANMLIQGMKLRILPFTFTQGVAAGDAGSLAYLRRLPPGEVWFYPKASEIQWDAFGASRVLDIGYAAYTAPDGTAVPVSAAKFDDDIDVSSEGEAALGSDYTHAVAGDTGQFKKFTSREGVTIYATVAGGTIPAGTVISGYLVIGMP